MEEGAKPQQSESQTVPQPPLEFQPPKKSWRDRLTSLTSFTIRPAEVLHKLAPTVLSAALPQTKVEDDPKSVLSIQEPSPVLQPVESTTENETGVTKKSLVDKLKESRLGNLFQKKTEEENPTVSAGVLDTLSERVDAANEQLNAALDVVLPGGKILAEQQRLAEARAAAEAQRREVDDEEAARNAAALVLDISTPESEEKSEGRFSRGVKAVSEFLSRKKAKEEKKDKEEADEKMAEAAGVDEYQDFGAGGSFAIQDKRSVVVRVVTGVVDGVKSAAASVADVFSKKNKSNEGEAGSQTTLLTNTNIAESADQLQARKALIDQDIIQLSGFINSAVVEIDKHLRDVKTRKLNAISDGVWTGPSRYTKSHILKSYESFTASLEDTEDKAQKAIAMDNAIEEASERWWTWGPLKLLRYVSSSYRESYDKLINGTRDFFETSLAAEELYIDVNALQGGREKFNRNFSRYQTYLNLKGDDEVEYINQRRFGTIFDKREEVIDLGHKVKRIEDVLNLNRKIQDMEKQLSGDLGEREKYRTELEEDLVGWIEDRARLVHELREIQMIHVSLPELTYRPGQPRVSSKMTEDESLRQTFGDLGVDEDASIPKANADVSAAEKRLAL